MLMLPPSVKIFLAVQPVDLRRSFDGLAEAARAVLAQDPFSGHLFVFRNKRGNRIKLLFWDRSGFVIWYKRLEQGYFRWNLTRSTAGAAEIGGLEVSAPELALLLEGIDLSGAKRQRRYARPGV